MHTSAPVNLAVKLAATLEGGNDPDDLSIFPGLCTHIYIM